MSMVVIRPFRRVRAATAKASRRAVTQPAAPLTSAGRATMLPIRDGRSRSLDGQGMTARWRRFRFNALPQPREATQQDGDGPPD
jgi:hypothetical protein